MILKLLPWAAGLILVILAAVNFRAWWPTLWHALPAVAKVAGITIAEARRRRVLHVALLLVVLILVSMTFFTYLQPGEEAIMLMSTGQAAVLFFGMLLCIFVGAFLIPREVEARTIYALLSKPVKRLEFVLGKYVGALAIIGFIVAVMGGSLLLTLWLKALAGGMGSKQATMLMSSLGDVAFSLVMYYCALVVFTALIIMVSTVASTTMTVICSVLIWVAGMLQGQIHHMMESQSGPGKYFLGALNVVLPHFENFDFRREIAQGVTVHYGLGGEAALHGLLYVAVVMVLAIIFFNDRQV